MLLDNIKLESCTKLFDGNVKTNADGYVHDIVEEHDMIYGGSKG